MLLFVVVVVVFLLRVHVHKEHFRAANFSIHTYCMVSLWSLSSRESYVESRIYDITSYLDPIHMYVLMLTPYNKGEANPNG